MIDDSKPALIWVSLTAAGTMHDHINLIGGIISIGYTLYKIIKDLKKKKNDEHEN